METVCFAPMALLLCGRFLSGHNALVGVLDALLPNLVDIAGESLGLHCAAAVFGNQLVHVVQLLLIVVGTVMVFLSVSRMIRIIVSSKRKMYESCRKHNFSYIVFYIYIYIYSSVF